ncbi:MAG: hypothetical protein J3K34DRAFT_473470 [Monoraphidium minutum]|nr:MAG: hypothetical protein J3K34DRAFT_473470 [Monoraphidium minutum]
MATQVRAVLLAAQPCGGGGGGGAAALQPLAGRPALSCWLEVLATSGRLRPLRERLVILASAATAVDVRAWAAPLGLAGCVLVAAPAGAAAGGGGGGGGWELGAGELRALAERAHPALEGATHLVIVDGAAALEPGTSIARMLEAAVIQSAPATAGVCTPLGAPLGGGGRAAGAARGGVQVELASRLESNSRVLAVHAAAGAGAGAAGGFEVPQPEVAPVCVFAHTALAAAAAAAAGGGAAVAVPQLLEGLLRGGGVPPLDLAAPEAARLADAFFQHYASMHQRLRWELQQAANARTRSGAGDLEPEQMAACTLVQLERALNRMGIQQAAASTGELRPPGGGGGAPEPYGGFRAVFAHWVDGYMSGLGSSAANPLRKDNKALPGRRVAGGGREAGAFTDAARFAHRTRREHPCYSTSAAQYGAKQATPLDMPLAWAGVHGRFTNTLCGGARQTTTFKTNSIRSRVHRALDEL